MSYTKFTYTKVPNVVFDELLAHCSESELKVFLIIIRQTLGRKHPYRDTHKTQDWITHTYFEKYTGLSKRAISTAIKKLIIRRLIVATKMDGTELYLSKDRKKSKYVVYKLGSRVTSPSKICTRTNAKSAYN